MKKFILKLLAVFVLALAVSVVFASSWTVVPDNDVLTNSWTTTPLWSKIDDDIDSPDGTVITSPDNPSSPADDINFTLTNISDSLVTDANIRVRTRRSTGSRNVHLNLSWFTFDGTLLLSFNTTDLTDVLEDYASGVTLVSVVKENFNSSYILAKPVTKDTGTATAIEIDTINLDITTDTTSFTIDFVAPTDNNETVGRNYSYVNVTTGEAPDTIQLEWDGTNESMSGSSTSWFKNKTGLSNANHTFKVWANDSAGNMNVSETRWVLTAAIYLDSTLILPLPGITTNVIQNNTFVVNATVICLGGECGGVNGTVRYNWSSAEPETPLNETLGDKPFFVNETPASAAKDCPNNPLTSGENCTLSWVINASGSTGNKWSIDVVFNSSVENITDNDTANSIISIIGCPVDFTLQWSNISFGNAVPNTGENAAAGNDDDEYNVTVNAGSCLTDLYIRGTDLENDTSSYIIGADNITWSNTTNTYSESHSLSKNNVLLQDSVAPVKNITTWYWLNTPPVAAGRYNGTVWITGVEDGQAP